MAIEGPLKELGIHDVFQLLDLTRKTGVLRISSDLRQNAGMVYFERGAVVGAVIESNPHRLGGLLLRAGKLSEGDLARAESLQLAGDVRRLGDILVDIEAIGRRDLERHMRAQVEEVIFELMSWSEGYFSFEERDIDHATVEAPVHIGTEALLMEAARRIDEWSRIERRVPHLGMVPRLAAAEPGSGGALDLKPLEWEVLAAVDGMRDLRVMADDLGRAEFDVARVVFGLLSTGVIVLHDPTLTPPTAEMRDAAALAARAAEYLALGDADAARITAEEAVATFPAEPEAHHHLATALHALGRHGDAAIAFEEALRLDPMHAAARRRSGLALVALGRFDEAVDAWERWSRLAERSEEEAAQLPLIRRLRDAAHTLADAVRGRHD
jgi:hypothetical protein